MRSAALAIILSAALGLSACARAPKTEAFAYRNAVPATIAAPIAPDFEAAPLAPVAERCRPTEVVAASSLAGRTITVEEIGDIALDPREVVLTFDDGPRPKTTPAILNALDAAGVKATFLMVGQMARSYPALVRQVAARGHTIGTHTQSHPNLASLSRADALTEVFEGERAVAAALTGSGYSRAPFFRFPSLADTPGLRAALAERGTVVIDVDIDSKDYLRTSGDAVARRTLAALKTRGKGVILFHDIHLRTAAMLPGLLAALKQAGYKVVHLAPPGGTPCGRLS